MVYVRRGPTFILMLQASSTGRFRIRIVAVNGKSIRFAPKRFRGDFFYPSLEILQFSAQKKYKYSYKYKSSRGSGGVKCSRLPKVVSKPETRIIIFKGRANGNCDGTYARSPNGRNGHSIWDSLGKGFAGRFLMY
jgi:hypothetical protein